MLSSELGMKTLRFRTVTFALCVVIGVGGGWVASIRAQSVSRTSYVRAIPDYGFNLNSQTRPSLANTSFSDSVAQLRPRLIRYPGGTIGDYWNWETGFALPIELWVPAGPLVNFRNLGLISSQRFRLSDYHALLNRVGAQAFLQLNVCSSRLLAPNAIHHQMRLVRNAQLLGMSTAHIQLGNEAYFPEEDFESRFPTGGSYAREMLIWLDSVRTIAPQAKVAVIGSTRSATLPSGEPNPERTRWWNDSLISILPGTQSVSFHYYYPPLAGGASPSLREFFGNGLRQWQLFKSNTIDFLPMGWRAWITEYNTNDGATSGMYSLATTWAHGLYTTLLFSEYLKESRVDLIFPHQITGSAPFAALDSYVAGVGDTTTNRLTAYGNAFRVLYGLLAGCDSAALLSFSPNPTTTYSQGSFANLHGWELRSSTQLPAYWLQNISSLPYSLTLSSLGLVGTYDVQILSDASPTTLHRNTTTLQITRSALSGSLTVPAYSLVSLTPRSSTQAATLEGSGSEQAVSLWPTLVTDQKVFVRWPLAWGSDANLSLISTHGSLVTLRPSIEATEAAWVATVELPVVSAGVYHLRVMTRSGVGSSKCVIATAR